MIKEVYCKLREESVKAGGINITPRHLESAIRVCEGNTVLIQHTPKCTLDRKPPAKTQK